MGRSGGGKRKVGKQQIAIKMKINVYNWHHWNGTETEDMLCFEVGSWNTVACCSPVHACVRALAWLCVCADVVGGWMRERERVGWIGERVVLQSKSTNACIWIDRFVINLFERLTRIYIWQTNFYLYRQSRKACLFAKNTHTEREREIKHKNKKNNNSSSPLPLLRLPSPKSKNETYFLDSRFGLFDPSARKTVSLEIFA